MPPGYGLRRRLVEMLQQLHTHMVTERHAERTGRSLSINAPVFSRPRRVSCRFRLRWKLVKMHKVVRGRK